jgi:hypothetical protein
MEYSNENCEKVAWQIVHTMKFEELQQFVFEDLYAIMTQDQEVFEVNVESLEG